MLSGIHTAPSHRVLVLAASGGRYLSILEYQNYAEL